MWPRTLVLPRFLDATLVRILLSEINGAEKQPRILWRIKSEYDSLTDVPVRSCRVTIQDMDGVSHTVEVLAATLYEAVARGLAALRGNEWVVGIAQGPSVVKVSVANVRVEHEVKFADLMKWLDRPPRSPRDVSARHEIRSILGMPASR